MNDSKAIADRTNDRKLAGILQDVGWIRRLPSIQKRREAIALRDWSFTEHFKQTCLRYQLTGYDFGAEPPDFVLIGGSTLAVEVTRIVTPKKAILDRAPFVSGGYVSALRRFKPGAEFHRQIQEGRLYPDNSLIRPHVESLTDLDADYYDFAEERLRSKAKSAKQIASSYGHMLILLVDELSEFSATVGRRLPRLRKECLSLALPSNVGVTILIDRVASELRRERLASRLDT